MQSRFWKGELKEFFSFNNFTKKASENKNFEKIKSNLLNTPELELFLTENNISFFEFYTSILSIYLSRTSRSEGIILAYNNISPNDTLFKISYNSKSSLLNSVFNVKTVLDKSLKSSMDNLKDYVDELYPEYSDYIFNYLIVDGEKNSNIQDNDSAIRFIIFEDAVEIEYDKNTFNRIEMETMMENIEYIILNFQKNINQNCCDINIVCDRQLKLLDEFSKGSNFEIEEKSLPKIISNIAKKYPNNFAINDEENRIRYNELYDLIKSTTYTLQKDYDISKSDKIILNLSRSYNIPLLSICLMKLGAITIPIDDSYPENYIQNIIDDSSAKYIIQETPHEFKNIESIALDSLRTSVKIDSSEDSDANIDFSDADVDLDDTALILYTSGVTGTPKGVEITQRNIININYNYINHFNIEEGGSGNFMCLAKFTFVASLPIYAALMNGSEAFIIRETSQDTIPKIVKYLSIHHCYVLISTQELGLYLYNNFDLNLDNLAFAGSSLTKANIRKNSSTNLFNAYGCSETSGSVIINKLNDDLSDYSVIGKPLGNSKVSILDENKKQLPIGSVGEIVISGPIVTKKYLNNQKETEKAYGKFNNEKAFFTNDLAYFNNNGEVVYLGRKDNQINLNGFRIEPEQIESTILDYKDMDQVKVIVGEINHQNHLIAYYSSELAIDENDLKEYLQNQLPNYMIPSFYMQMEVLPLNPNGKIDVKKLPPIEVDEVEFAKARDEYEEMIVKSFEKFFNNDKISIYDDFIQLGGNSIIAMKILSELDEYNLTINDLIRLRTPERIAKHIKNNEMPDFDWNKYSINDACPLNESQLNVYLDIQRNENNEEYNIPLRIKIDKSHSIEDVKNALNEIFKVHPILKTHIEIIDGTPYLNSGKTPEIKILKKQEENKTNHINELLDSKQEENKTNKFMNESFDLNESLSRFLLVENNDELSLIAVFHHLIFDGFSSMVFRNDLFDLLNGKTLETDVGFIKASIYDEEIIKEPKYEEAEKFYDSMLSEANEIAPLLSSVEGNEAGAYCFDLSIEKNEIQDFLKANNITENILFTEVFAYALSRFTGDSQVLFNILDNGRDTLNNYKSIGMFVNTLPLLVDCHDKEIKSYTHEVKELILKELSYNFYPFRILANKYNINSSILFQYLPNSDENDETGLFYNVSDLDFTILKTDDEKYSIKVIYSSLYSMETIKRFTESYNMILNQIIKADKLSEISYTAGSDIELLNEYNQTEHALEYNDILEAFNDNLSQNPNSPLVSMNDKVYSYAEGAFIADKLSKGLIELKVETGDCVAFLLERSEIYVPCILGIMSMGGIYVPLDDKLPDERINFILEDCDANVIVASDETYERVCSLSHNCDILNISEIIKGDTGKNLSNTPKNTIDETGKSLSLPLVYRDIACILYTSGTTGIPKGVKITRKSILNLSEFYIRAYGLNNDDVYGLFASIGFDVSIKAIFSSIYAGACLSVIPGEIKLDITAMNEYFIKQGVTHTEISTQVAKLFIDQIDETSLKVLTTGGENLGESEIEVDYRFVDSYGPTEACVDVTSIDSDERIDPSSIGFLIDNTKAYVLDEEFRRAPVGAVGELYLSGYQIADGYLNREEETAKAFLKNPFNDSEDYPIMYRTGDMVRVLPDGSLAIVGRRDSQVKIRGNRVELTEVESSIREMKHIKDVTVQTVKKGSNNELVAYVVTDKKMDKNTLKEDLCDYIAKSKPSYMVPSYVMALDAIPLNVNGKVDKNALPEIDLSSLQTEYVAPRTEREKKVTEAFEKAFDMESIGIYDDFIQLGGESLTAIKLASYLEEYEISIAAILRLGTPYAIAKNMKEITYDLNIFSLESGCPLNESQLNVYLDIAAKGKVNSYLMPLAMEIPKKYDTARINTALEEMMNVHPILGMCVSDEYDVPYLVKGNKPQIIFKTNIKEESVIEFLTKPFDLHKSLCRFLIMEEEDKHSLLAVFHHIIFDALSNNVFKEDLLAILEGETIDIDDSFLKVSAFSQEMQNSDETESAKDFYESMLAESDETGLFLESVNSDGPGSIEKDMDLKHDSIKPFLIEQGISENVLFTSVFAYTLSRYVGGDSVQFNIIENGRDRFNNFNSIGMYVNTLPILVNCKNQNISSFMDYMSNLVYDVMKYNYYPFRLLIDKYNIDANIMFQYLPDWTMDTDNDNYNKNMEDIILGQMDDLIADFTAELIQKNENYKLQITYSNKYSSDFIEHFIESYKLILQEMLKVEKLGDIDYITDKDIKLLDSYNQTEYGFEHKDILEAFDNGLSKYSDNILVGYENRSYTHGEGAYIANEIANKIHSLNIAKQDKVALIVPRSEWFLLASLGVLTAGAIYVPIDTTYPDDRIMQMLKDSQAKGAIVSEQTEQRVMDIINKSKLDIKTLNMSKITKSNIKSSKHLNYEAVNENDIACILYTSGTTGVPKGVLITRKAINNFVSWYVKETDFNDNDVYGMYCSYVFDMHTHALYSPLITGGSLYVVPEDIRLDLKALNDYFVEHNCTHTYITSQVGKLFAESGMETSIKLLCFGGMKLGELNAPDSIGPFESYGPSENLAISTSIFANKRIHPSSIGKLVNNVKAYVLDNEQRQVPIGAAGELYLSGHQLTPGYLNREEENKKAFFNNPFDNTEGYKKIYKTGDIVRFLPDGTLGIIGRRDNQVKVRGNRVELTEVESTIRELEYVEDVTVQTVKSNSNHELVAYIVSEEMEENHLKESVSEYISQHKPDYMIPSFIIKINEIPLTVNGKVDKQSLPEVDMNRLKAEYVAPRTEIEEIITDTFKTIFNEENIGIYDDFIRLGGDSIIAIRMISSLHKQHISCSAKDILTYKTPYLISQHVKIDDSVKSYESTEGIVDLLPIQSYFFDQINENNFTQQFVLKIKEDLDVDILQKSFDELANIHDILRAVYRFDEDNNPIQEILPVNTHICDINEHFINDNFNNTQKEQKTTPNKHNNTENEQEQSILDKFNESIKDILMESIQNINIKSKLIDINLVHHNNENYMIIVAHHLIIDGISWNNLLVDLTEIYLKLSKGEEIDILRPYPYKYWVDDVKTLVESISDEEKQHWTKVNNQLDDSLIKGNAKNILLKIDKDYNKDNLLNLSEEEYLALAIVRAYKNTYNEDVIFNRESHGRDDSIANINQTIGWFTSQYPVTVETNNGYDPISLTNDIYSIKTALKDVNNLGLNYASLIYTSHDLEFKHCPITFNFLGNEFIFKNELFESINHLITENDSNDMKPIESKTYGITLNIGDLDDSYIIDGEYADKTYLSEKFDEFIENIKSELRFIGEYEFKEIICSLSEPQLGIYLDEKVNEKSTAYSVPGILDCKDKSMEEIKDAIDALIEKHPILKGRILDNDLPLLVCDTYPTIETVNEKDYMELIKPFDLNKNLTRFYIVNNDEGRFILYDMHHIISDASSRIIINNELEDILNGKIDNKTDLDLKKANSQNNTDLDLKINPENNKTDLGFVYASLNDFESKFKAEYELAHEFFIEQFADIDETYTILNDIDGSKGSITLPIRGIKDKIDSFTHEIGITTSNLLNSVFAYTYSRFTGSDKVYYTFTEHGRHESYTQNSLGMFIRTIPIIADCKNKSVEEFLDEMSDSIINSMMNSNYPFRLLAKEFNLNNNVSFEYNYDLNDVSNIGDEMEFSEYADTVSEFSCVVNDLEDGFAVNLSHSNSFSQDTAIRFVNVFKEILIQILDKEELSDINYVSNDDIKLLNNYNQTEKVLKYDNILDAFNDNLSQNPNAPLVSMNDNSFTYAEGAFIADKIANDLRALGVGMDDNVAFVCERSEYYMFDVLSILSLGAVPVPIDDALPDERIRLMIEDSSSKAIIVSNATYERVCSLSDDIAVLNVSEIIEGKIGRLSHLPVSNGNLAGILYTSGTTGVPKGVKITKKAVLNLAEHYAEAQNLSNEDVYALYPSIGFDAGYKSIFKVLYSGCSLAIVPEEIKLDMKKLNDYFIRHNVGHVFITTQVSKLFMDSVEETSLKVLSVGGEKLGEFESPESYLLMDDYGPTEAFAFISSIDNSKKIDDSSIGSLNINSKAYILDNEGRQVPVGAVGELYLGGNQIAEGYLNREDENRKAFVDNPFDENHKLMYRTGDMARILPDGTLGLVGRRDSQVKIRGNRVELTEVESIIRELDYVDDLTVQVFDGKLASYIVAKDDISEKELFSSVTDFVAKHKPNYMVPSFVVKLDSIPLTINGKVNKNALPKPELSDIEIIAPQNDIEKGLLEICHDLSNVSNFGVKTNLFNLGFSSLTFMKLNHEILKEYDVDLGIGFLLNNPYIQKIAEAVINNDSYSLKSYPPQKYYPLTSMQRTMAIFSHSDLSKQKFVLHEVASLNEFNDVDKLKSSIIKVIDTHASMKAQLLKKDDEIILKRDDDLDISQFIEIRKVDEITDELLNDTIFEFNDFEDALFRFTIYHTSDEVKLVSNIHHIIMDVYSIKLFIEDVKLAYEGKEIEEEIINMYDLTLNELEYENTIQYKQSEEYYLNILKEYEEVKLPKNQEDYSSKENANVQSIEIDDIEIEEFCSENNISPSILFMASSLLALDKFTYSTMSSLSNIYNGRYNASLYKTYGELSKELLLIVNRDNREETVKSLFEKINDSWNNALKHSMYPVERLYDKENISSTITYRYFEDFVPSFLEFEDQTSQLTDIDRDLEIAFVKESENKFLASITYNQELYTGEYMETFLDSIRTIIEFIVDSDVNHTRLKDISLSNEYLGDFSEDIYIPTLVELFEKQVSINPDKTALIVNDEEISYWELNQNANRIANRLIGKAPSKSNIVVLLPRTKELMYSIWGILKAGCAFIPLDESYPEDRIKYIIENSDSSVVITDKDLPNSIHPNELLNGENDTNTNLQADDTNPDLDISPNDVAYILYTSGTTGKPKGVKVSHRNIVNITMPSEDNNLNQAFTKDIKHLLTLTHVNYTPSVIDYTTALTSGITVVYANNDEIKNISSLIKLMDKYKPEIIGSITPSRLTEFLEVPEFVEVFQYLKRVVLLGEKFPPILYTKIRSKHKSIKIYNDYGSTESVGIGLKEVTNENDITIGLPMHNVKRYIVDIDEQVLPPLVQGHLYISGPSVSLGYTNSEEDKKTYAEFNGKRFIKTGDLVVLQLNSEIKLYGRVDKQLKLRGQRLESEEIISLINKYPGITNSIITIDKINNFEHLIAYYVSSNQINEKDLRTYLERKLPIYMVPTYFIEIPEIPTNLHGKVDTTKLPKLNFNEMSYEAPRTEMEKTLIEFAKKLTNVERIGIDTNLISIGFTSLTFMNFNYEIFKAFGVELNIDTLLSEPFIKDIAKAISNTQKSIKSYPIQKYYPLTTMQEVMFTFSYILKKSVIISDVVNIDSDMDAERLRNAILKTINTKTSIKTRFVKRNGTLMQWREDDLNIDHLVELKKVDEISDELIFNELYEFNLLNENLFHFTILQSNSEIRLVFSIHHILVDLYSLKLFFDDVLKAYDGEELDKEIVNLFDFTIAETEFLNSQQCNEAEDYYLEMLSDYEDIKLPKDQKQDLDEKVLKGIADNLNDFDIIGFCNEQNISPSVLFMTSTLLALDEFTDSSKSLLTNIYNGRHSSSLYQTFGNLSRELPLIVNRDDRNQSIKALLTGANENWNTALKYGMYPFERMFHKKNMQYSTITYRYFEDFIPELLKDDLVFNSAFIGDRDLEIYFIKNYDGSFFINLSYNCQLYTDEYMKSFLKSVKKTIGSIITCDVLETTINDVSKIKEIEAIKENSKIKGMESIKKDPKIDETETSTEKRETAEYETPRNEQEKTKIETPRNELEKTIVRAFELVFNQRISIDDDFVSLGGTSLTSMMILRYLYDYGIEDIDLFKLRTPRAIAEYIESKDN